MAGLNADEQWLVDGYFRKWGVHGSYTVSAVVKYMQTLYHRDVLEPLATMMSKGLLERAQDTDEFWFTEAGLQTLGVKPSPFAPGTRPPSQGPAPVSRAEALKRAEEVAGSSTDVREMMTIARKELCILDSLVDSALFAKLQQVDPAVPVRIVTTEQGAKAARAAYDAHKKNRPKTEMRALPQHELSDGERYLLIDGEHGFQLDQPTPPAGEQAAHSYKPDPSRIQKQLFEHYWKKANPVS